MERRTAVYIVRGLAVLHGILALYVLIQMLSGLIAAARGSGWGIGEAIAAVVMVAIVSFLGWVALGLWHEHNGARKGGAVIAGVMIIGGLIVTILSAVGLQQYKAAELAGPAASAVPMLNTGTLVTSLLVAVIGGVLFYLFAFHKDVKALFDPSVAQPVVNAVLQDVQTNQPQTKV